MQTKHGAIHNGGKCEDAVWPHNISCGPYCTTVNQYPPSFGVVGSLRLLTNFLLHRIDTYNFRLWIYHI